MTTDAKTRKVVLEHIYCRWSQYKSGREVMNNIQLYDLDLHAGFPIAFDMLVVHLCAWVVGETPKEYECVYPQDWWHAFKDRWFPVWALKRWPVIRTHFKVRADLVYPEFKIQMPKERHNLTFTVSNYDYTDGKDQHTPEPWGG